MDKTIFNVALKLENDKYYETKLFFKIDMYFETEGVYFILQFYMWISFNFNHSVRSGNKQFTPFTMDNTHW